MEPHPPMAINDPEKMRKALAENQLEAILVVGTKIPEQPTPTKNRPTHPRARLDERPQRREPAEDIKLERPIITPGSRMSENDPMNGWSKPYGQKYIEERIPREVLGTPRSFAISSAKTAVVKRWKYTKTYEMAAITTESHFLKLYMKPSGGFRLS